MKPPKNIIFIGVDALRYDCISCEEDRRQLNRYGAANWVETPEIDRFARQGVRFSQAIAVTPYTSASFASIFTGLYPPRHNVRATYYTKLAPTATTLAEQLKGAGYRTFQVLDLANQLNPTEVTRGIDHRFLTTLKADETDKLFQALAENKGEKTFLFAYFLDVSNPYGFSHVDPWQGYNDDYFRALEELKERFAQGEEAAEDRRDKYYTWCGIKHTMFSGTHKDEVVGMYIDGVNKFSRGRFAWFMGRLRELGFMEDALVVITADHGEGDYGFDFTHGGELTEDIVRVPLIMSYPGGLPEGRVVDEQVSQVDITPTVLDIAGIRCDASFDGESLVPAIKGREDPGRVAYGEVWGYQWEKVRKFLFSDGLLKNEKPQYDVFLKQRILRTPRCKYVLNGESNEEGVDDFNKEILVKWAFRNIFFRHETDHELKQLWNNAYYSDEIDEAELIRSMLAMPDTKERHGLFDLVNDPAQARNLLLGEKDDVLLCKAIELQDELLRISETGVPDQHFARTVYSNIEKNDEEKEMSAERLASKPVRILTDLTNRCNIRCRICYRNYTKGEDADFKLEWFRDLSPLFATLMELQLSCDGEPFVYEHIHDVLDLLEQYPHLFTVAVSNGTVLGKRGLPPKIIRSIKRLGISFDGGTRETYEAIRRGAGYDQVIGNILELNRLKKEHDSPYPEIIFHFVPMHRNIRELPQLIELADRLDIRFITAKHLGIVNEDMERALDGECMFYHQELYNAVLAQSEKRAGELGVHLDFPPPYALSNTAGGVCGVKPPSTECFEPWETVYISPRGSVKACCGSREVFGNLDEMSFEEIWDSRKYRKLRATVNSDNPLPMCRNCTSAGVRGRVSKKDEKQSYYRYAKKGEIEEQLVAGGNGGNGGSGENGGPAEDCGDGEPRLNTAIWFLTWKCNNRCPYCWEMQRQARGEFTPEDFLSADTWVEAWNRLLPGTLDITGGEPWLQPGFIDMLEGLDDRIRIAITTNATGDLTEFVQRIDPERVCSMTLSLHPTQRMSKESFIGKCQMLRNRGFPVTVNFVTWPEQMWLIPMYKELFENQGIRFHVDPYAATPYHPYEFSEHEKEFLRQYVTEDRSHWFGEVEKCSVLCSGGHDHLNVQPNGDAFRCIQDKILNRGKVGNILAPDFSLHGDWTRCEEYHRCPGCDKDKVKIKRLKDGKCVERSEPLSYTL